LVVVVHGDKGPVCDNACNAKRPIRDLASDEIFDSGSVKELNVREGEDFGEEGGSEEGLMSKRSARH
jgi:hypothetical protein